MTVLLFLVVGVTLGFRTCRVSDNSAVGRVCVTTSNKWKKFDIDVKPEYGKAKVAKDCDSDYSLLANMQAKGIDAPSSCNAGTCNACAARFEISDGASNLADVLAPEVEFSESEIEMMMRGFLLTCTTRCVGRGLSLELGAEDDV